MEPSKVSTDKKPKNLICNFRAKTIDYWNQWQKYKEHCWNHGLDLCHTTISLTNSFMGLNSEIKTPNQTMNIQMNNQFNYVVQKPRRKPYSLSCVKPEFRRTINRAFVEAYILQRAHEMEREFCFRDFMELEYNAFRRTIVRLKRKHKIKANPIRTIPQMYYLPELAPTYEKGFEYNRVKQMFTTCESHASSKNAVH